MSLSEIPPFVWLIQCFKNMFTSDRVTHLNHLTSLTVIGSITSLPDSIGQLTQLEDLSISRHLTSLPDSLAKLTKLTNLDISHNKLTSLPACIGRLTKLSHLNISYNRSLYTLPVSLHNISTLKEFNCNECEALTSPPYTVCKQGIEAVFKYLGDLKLERGQILTPVTVIRKSRAGKTSPVRSSQHNKQGLTRRNSVKKGISSDSNFRSLVGKL